MHNSQTKLFSVGFSTLTAPELTELFCKAVRQGRTLSVFTPNLRMLCRASKSRELLSLLNSSSLNIPDGIGVALASRFAGGRRLCRIGGIDLAESFLQRAALDGLSLFLLGGTRDVARRAAEALARRYEGLRICGTHHGYFEKSQDENEKVLTQIRRARPDILFVCFGFPLQERWIANNLASLPSVRLAMGLGGSLDVWSGRLRRAPRAVRAIGLEWLWRIILEPSRAEIFLDIPLFLLLLMRYRKAQKELSRHFFT